MMNMNTMNDMTEDVLLGRVGSGEDGDDRAWRAIETAAKNEPALWERTARALHAELGVRQSLESALAAADRAEIPDEAFDLAHLDAPDDEADAFGGGAGSIPGAGAQTYRISPAMTHWSGWAVAAMIAIAWLGVWTNRPLVSNGNGAGPMQAGPPEFSLTSLSPDEVYDAYRVRGYEEGRLVQELPMLMVETRAIRDGQAIEVLYIRQTLERATVDSVFSFSEDETGQMRYVPVPKDRLLRQNEAGSPL